MLSPWLARFELFAALRQDGWPVIADFGLASTAWREDRPLFSVCGTPEFMAPEVLTS